MAEEERRSDICCVSTHGVNIFEGTAIGQVQGEAQPECRLSARALSPTTINKTIGAKLLPISSEE